MEQIRTRTQRAIARAMQAKGIQPVEIQWVTNSEFEYFPFNGYWRVAGYLTLDPPTVEIPYQSSAITVENTKWHQFNGKNSAQVLRSIEDAS